MQIHTVKEGDCLYSIARKYEVPVTKILADNDLCTDRLTIGDELIIMTPTRTLSVRGGDTLDGICKRFGVKERDVLALNPSLMGKRKLRPGQILTVKQKSSYIGVGSAVGIAEKGCRYENLTRTLPYLTYLIINSAVIDNGGVSYTYNPEKNLDMAKGDKKITLFGIKDNTDGEFLLSEATREKIIDEAISLAKDAGFCGIAISSGEGGEKYPTEFCDFLLLCRKKLIGCDMILFTEIFPSTPTDASEISDGAILHIDSSSPEKAKEHLKNFSDKAESSKVFIKLDSSIPLGDGEISISDAKELCYRCGSRLSLDKNSLQSGFEYTRYRNGASEKIDISFPSLKLIKAELEALCELGFMGIGFDVDNLPISNLILFGYLFARADYSLP